MASILSRPQCVNDDNPVNMPQCARSGPTNAVISAGSGKIIQNFDSVFVVSLIKSLKLHVSRESSAFRRNSTS